MPYGNRKKLGTFPVTSGWYDDNETSRDKLLHLIHHKYVHYFLTLLLVIDTCIVLTSIALEIEHLDSELEETIECLYVCYPHEEHGGDHGDTNHEDTSHDTSQEDTSHDPSHDDTSHASTDGMSTDTNGDIEAVHRVQDADRLLDIGVDWDTSGREDRLMRQRPVANSTDTEIEDTNHEDTSHTDTSHDDTGHGDTSHIDTTHEDTTHEVEDSDSDGLTEEEEICRDKTHNHDFGKDSLKDAEEGLAKVSIAILCVFLFEHVLLLTAMGRNYFKHFFYLFDVVIISTSLALEIVFQNQPEAGLLIVARVWRFVRIVHGFAESTADEITAKTMSRLEQYGDDILGAYKEYKEQAPDRVLNIVSVADHDQERVIMFLTEKHPELIPAMFVALGKHYKKKKKMEIKAVKNVSHMPSAFHIRNPHTMEPVPLVEKSGDEIDDGDVGKESSNDS